MAGHHAGAHLGSVGCTLAVVLDVLESACSLQERVSPWRCRVFAGVGILLACVACHSDSLRLRNNEVLHPTPANAPSPDATVLQLTVTDLEWSRAESAAWRDARDKIAGARTTLAIGDNRAGPTNFGLVRDVAVTPVGDVLVLDDDAQEVRVFDSAGRFVQRIGGLGDGPTEFRHANGIELFGDRRLIVSSRGSRQFKLFRETETGWDLDGIAELPVVATDMCAMGTGSLFLAGFTEDENLLVHEFVDQGIVSSLAEGYQPGFLTPIGRHRSPGDVKFMCRMNLKRFPTEDRCRHTVSPFPSHFKGARSAG